MRVLKPVRSHRTDRLKRLRAVDGLSSGGRRVSVAKVLRARGPLRLRVHFAVTTTTHEPIHLQLTIIAASARPADTSAVPPPSPSLLPSLSTAGPDPTRPDPARFAPFSRRPNSYRTVSSQPYTAAMRLIIYDGYSTVLPTHYPTPLTIDISSSRPLNMRHGSPRKITPPHSQKKKKKFTFSRYFLFFTISVPPIKGPRKGLQSDHLTRT